MCQHLCVFFYCYSYSVSSNAGALGGGSISPTIHAPASYPGGPPGGSGTNSVSEVGAGADVGQVAGTGKQARVLYDYDAADLKELSLVADEVGILHARVILKHSKLAAYSHFWSNNAGAFQYKTI